MNTIARLLLPVDGAHAACCEQMAAAMGNAEGAALKGLQMCIDTIMAEVCCGYLFKPLSWFSIDKEWLILHLFVVDCVRS